MGAFFQENMPFRHISNEGESITINRKPKDTKESNDGCYASVPHTWRA